MPMFWDYEYHKRALDRREAERGEIDKGGRINLSRRREVYENGCTSHASGNGPFKGRNGS